MACAKRHPKDGNRRYDYDLSKIAHLKRCGLVAANKSGYGRNGGACPDWLLKEQDDQAQAANKRLLRAVRARFGRQPDIDWFTPVKAS